MEKSLSVSNPIALVTGASSGIGAAYAGALAEAGYDLILVARREDRLRALQRQIGEDRAEILAADLSSDDGVETVAARIEAESRLDFLVNNAGFGTTGDFWDASLQSQMDMHRLHILATVGLTHAALPRMVTRNRGFVVNVSSVAGFSQNAGSISYCATKRWMNSFSEGLWLELKQERSQVRVQALCPGFTRSEFHDSADLDVSQVPESLWTSPETVVEASMRGLAGNSLFVVPGWRYQVWVAMQNGLPRRVVQAITNRSRETFRRPKHA